MEFGDVNFGRNFNEKSKWVFKSGVEYINYPVSLPEYKGEHETYSDSDSDDLNGYGLSFGRDFYISNGFSTLVSFNFYYSKTLDKKIGKAADDIDFDYASTRSSHELFAYEGSIAINYIFDNKLVDVQPFFEAGFGVGENKVNKEYTTLGFTDIANSSEDYDVNVTEEFALSRISIGMNFISYKGLMSYVKLTSVTILKTNRETQGESNLRGTDAVINYDANETGLSESRTMTMASVGIGRYF
jgi:hypothetical protein